MPRRNRFFFKALLPLGLLVAAVFALARRGGDDWEYEQDDPVTEDAPQVPHATRRPAARFALAAAFTMLFFAGASFTAGAGDQMARLLDDDAVVLEDLGAIAAGQEPTATEAQPAEAAPAVEPAVVEQVVEVESAPEVAASESPAAAADATLEPQAAPAEQASN
ncbi:MAG TPA: hypothetical protein VFV62_06540, partial [Gaiellaceae bacterium]|nr:hypothetical protein [Gaiellaceae bacterium]